MWDYKIDVNHIFYRNEFHTSTQKYTKGLEIVEVIVALLLTNKDLMLLLAILLTGAEQNERLQITFSTKKKKKFHIAAALVEKW